MLRLPSILCCFFFISIALSSNYAKAKEFEITFNLDAYSLFGENEFIESVGIRGNVAPLSWQKSLILDDIDSNGIFSIKLVFDAEMYTEIEFKYVAVVSSNSRSSVSKNVIWELSGKENRIHILYKPIDNISHVFDLNEYPRDPDFVLPVYDSKQLQLEFEIVSSAIRSLHPSLLRYQDSVEMLKNENVLSTFFLKQRNLAEVYLAYSRYLASIKCGHTFPNAYKQSPLIKYAFYYSNDKLPFDFKWFNNRMIVVNSASKNSKLIEGHEVLSINGINTSTILESLLPYTATDGNNKQQQIKQLEVRSKDHFNQFDVLYSLAYPNKNKFFTVKIKDLKSQKIFDLTLEYTTIFEREKIIAEKIKNTDQAQQDWYFNMLNENTAYINLSTFAVWNFSYDWKKYIDNFFGDILERGAEKLIIDIRDNEGGFEQVNYELISHLSLENIEIKIPASYTSYDIVDDGIKPYLIQFNNNNFDIRQQVEPSENGYYKLIESEKVITIEPKNNVFVGDVFLLVNSKNRSATYQTTKYFSEFNLGTIIGSGIGGNQRGISGNSFFYLHLPYSKIEIDIPRYSYAINKSIINAAPKPMLNYQEKELDYILNNDGLLETVLNILNK